MVAGEGMAVQVSGLFRSRHQLGRLAENQSAAQSLANRSFDLVFEGDDLGELFAFDLPFDPFVPSVVR
jgi:hypothetical protein